MVEMVLEAARATAPQFSPRTRGGVRSICQLIPPPFQTFHGEEFAAQIVRRNPLAPGNSYFARTRNHETILALRLVLEFFA